MQLSLLLSLAACHGGSGTGREDRDGGDSGDSAVGGDGDGDGDGDVDAGPLFTCGDGVRQKAHEACDDGNVLRGDGCDDECDLEAGYKCAAKGGGCAATCGDGLIVAKEECDDGNSDALDGCDQACQLEAGWNCPTPKSECVAGLCGDGIQVGAETCDDKNENNGDGCDVTCQLEAGWICIGMSCTAKKCGDGIVAGDEVCDDTNTDSSDGCVEDCSAVEPFHTCPAKGGACVRYTICGDGNFTADEGCDDGNDANDDGCDNNCAVQDGWVCPGGTGCDALCGDGKVVGNEQCDDDDAMTCKGGAQNGQACQIASDCPSGSCGGQSNDGCSDKCQLEPDFDCSTAGQACTPAECGNADREGLEECDDTPADEVDQPYDGCYQCKREPSCSTGGCASLCGDGFKFPDEICDDGNTRSGDGCSADCTNTEAGFACTNVDLDPPDCVDLPLILRDFKRHDAADHGHADFNSANGSDRGMVRATLGADLNDDGVADENVAAGTKLGPVYARDPATGAQLPLADPPVLTTTHGAARFNEWYRDSELGKRVAGTLTVCDDDGDGTYVFDDRTFYPVDGEGWQDTTRLGSGETAEGSSRDSSNSPTEDDPTSNGCGPLNTSDPDANQDHNFHFTSEVRFWFTYKGGEKLKFRGDDDVWVFIAGTRVIDLGGVHCAQESTVQLVDGDAQIDDNDGNQDFDDGTVDLNLEVDRLYEVVVYQAERHTSQSSYRLELGKFFAKRTECVEVCGDGVRTKGELCDSGRACVGGDQDGESCTVGGDCTGGTCTSLNDGAYGHCSANCKARGPYCGNGTEETPPEQCDLGADKNAGAYGQCNPDCTLAAFCGDGNVDGFFGEQCDLGADRNVGGYNGCQSDCSFGERCGDGKLQKDEGEECDDKANRAIYDGCAPGCVQAPFCGDGFVQAAQGEQCDFGAGKNKGGYGGCEATCKRAAFCGDGHTDEPHEECDDKNTNNFDGCSAKCKDELVVF